MTQLRQRHQFLRSIGRAQLDPAKPNYVPLNALAMSSDKLFAETIAKCPVTAYNEFVKTLWFMFCLVLEWRIF